VTARPRVIVDGLFPFFGFAVLGLVVLGCSSDNDGATPSPTATVAPGLRQDAPTIAPPSSTSPPSTTATLRPQPTDTPVPPTPTSTSVPPTPTQSPVPTPTPEPGSIAIQLVSGSPGLAVNLTVNPSSACVPNSFVLAAGNMITVTCSNGEASFVMKFPAPGGFQPSANLAACSVQDEGVTPGASSGLELLEFPDQITVVLAVNLQDFEDVRCVINVP
jgi:hypothetical protein